MRGFHTSSHTLSFTLRRTLCRLRFVAHFVVYASSHTLSVLPVRRLEHGPASPSMPPPPHTNPEASVPCGSSPLSNHVNVEIGLAESRLDKVLRRRPGEGPSLAGLRHGRSVKLFQYTQFYHVLILFLCFRFANGDRFGVMKEKARTYLRTALGQPDADFREGQWESIEALLNRRRLLVVERTG